MIRNGLNLFILIYFLVFVLNNVNPLDGFFSTYIIKYTNYASKNERYAFMKFILPFNDKSWFLGNHNDAIVYSDFDTITICNHNLTKITNILRSYRCITRFTEDHMFTSRDLKFLNNNNRRGSQTPYYLQADMLWSIGVKGQGVRVGIFDTGINHLHSHFRNARIIEITNWTDEPSSIDTIGHGTFVAGLFVSDPEENSRCPRGISPDIDVYIFRLFTHKQTSYTSWFLDAFNYAMARNIDIINLSIGGPDFKDYPFVEKVWELSANGILMVSANGNDGPLYGTQNNPADQMDVIGVGGIDFDNRVTKFSSRGMTTWELPHGYGRLKPDIVTYSSQLISTSHTGSCKALSGTSVASPSIAAIAALLMSSTNEKLSPAFIKQALLSTATKLSPRLVIKNGRQIPYDSYNMFEQGMGKINLLAAYRAILEAKPQVTAYPSYIDFTEEPYMWPYSEQPLYSTGMPVIVNLTILNSMGVSGYFIERPKYIGLSQYNGEKIRVSISYSTVLWPWSGYLAVSIDVPDKFSNWSGIAYGYILGAVESRTSTNNALTSVLKIPIRVPIIPKPPRMKRVLWDQFHNLRYPPGYIPRDNIRRQEPLDWTGDHIHTNFKDSFSYLRSKGYYIEVLGSHYGCFNAKNYGYLIIPDPEEEYFPSEIKKLHEDVTQNGLSLIILAEWYNTDLMKHLKFFDENTRRWWTPDTGGSNIPALNQLLEPFNIQLSSQVLEGNMKLGNNMLYYRSGTSISEFPSSADHVSRIVYGIDFTDLTTELLKSTKSYIPKSAIIGLYGGPKLPRSFHGHISIIGDSNCFDMTNREKDCLWLWDSFFHFSKTGHIDSTLVDSVSIVHPQVLKSYQLNNIKPERLKGSRLHKFSSVVKMDNFLNKRVFHHKPICNHGNSISSTTVFDNTSIPNKSWFEPQKLQIKNNVVHIIGVNELMNKSLNRIIQYHRRRPQMHQTISKNTNEQPEQYQLQQKPIIPIQININQMNIERSADINYTIRHMILSLIPILSSCFLVIWWLYKRLKICKMYHKKIRNNNRLLFKNNQFMSSSSSILRMS